MKVKREKSTNTKTHYVTNAVLLPAVLEAKELGKVTDKLIRMILMIAERYSRKSNFVGYSFREDMVSAAMLNLSNNALKFNPEKSNNPFSFYTTAIHHSFLQFMADEKKHRTIRDSLLIDAGANPSFNFLEAEKTESAELKESDEIVSDVEGNPVGENVAEMIATATASIAAQQAAAAAALALANGTTITVEIPIVQYAIKPKELKVRAASRQSSETRKLTFTTLENGNVILPDGTLILAVPVRKND